MGSSGISTLECSEEDVLTFDILLDFILDFVLWNMIAANCISVSTERPSVLESGKQLQPTISDAHRNGFFGLILLNERSKRKNSLSFDLRCCCRCKFLGFLVQIVLGLPVKTNRTAFVRRKGFRTGGYCVVGIFDSGNEIRRDICKLEIFIYMDQI